MMLPLEYLVASIFNECADHRDRTIRWSEVFTAHLSCGCVSHLAATTTSSSVRKMTFAELSKVAAKENSKQLNASVKALRVGAGAGATNQKNEKVNACCI